MLAQTPTRRSARERRLNSRYVGAGWDREALRRIRAASESSGSSESNSDINGDPSKDEDFDAVVAEVPQDTSSEDEQLSFASKPSSGSPSDKGDDFERNFVLRTPDQQSKQNVRRLPAATNTGVSVGLSNVPRQVTAALRLPLIFGPGDDDLAPIKHARNVWLKSRDATLPSKAALSDPQSSFTFLEAEDEEWTEVGIPRQPRVMHDIQHQSKTEEQQGKEANCIDFMPELDTTSLKNLCQRQKLIASGISEVQSKGFLEDRPPHTVITGPINTQRLTVVDAYRSEPLQASANPGHNDGWLLNLGEKIQALSWAPRPGLAQYLAVVVRSTPAQREGNGPSVPRSFGPAFTPSSSYPSSVQIWKFESAVVDGLGVLGLDTTKAPKLFKVIGVNAGDIRQIRWGPTTNRTADPSLPLLLAILSTDSHVRVVAVDFCDDADTSYLELETPVIDIPPPTNPMSDLIITGEDPVFSVITWISPQELLVGTSNGLTFTYDILETISPVTALHIDSSTESAHQLTPYQTLSPHQTYVTALAPAHPILPNTHRLVASSSAGGDLALTALAPSHPASAVSSQRSRLPSRLLTYSPYTRSFLTIYPPSAHSLADRSTFATVDTSLTNPSDAIGTGGPTLVAHHLRRFPHLLQLARLPGSGGAATALADASLHHPCVLMGNSGGEVWCTNYLRRCLASRPRNRGRGGWMLRIVKGDWREEIKRAVNEEERGARHGENEKRECKDLYHGPATRKGMTRLVFGWKAMAVELGVNKGNGDGDGKTGKKKKHTDGGRVKKAGAKRRKITRAQKPDGDEMNVEGDGDGDVDVEEHQIEPPIGRPPSAATTDPTAWTDAALSNATTGDQSHSSPTKRSKVISIKMPPTSTGKANTKPKLRTKAKIKSGPEPVATNIGAAEVMFEEEQAVTALDWSKDRRTAGWAAVGWGSGLVLVRDLSV